jgi:thioesterase domain-containing protein
VPFFELARDMAAEGHSDYGIQAKGVDGLEEPFDRGEDLAAFYLRSLRDIQPHGPYLLVGSCFEGLVAPGNGAQPTTRRIPPQYGPG